MAKYNLVQAVFDRGELSPDEDVAVCTMHIRQTVQASPDILDVTDQGRSDFIGEWNDFWSQVKQYVSTKVFVRELRFYEVPDLANTDMGDPVLVSPLTVYGTSTSVCLPPQCAISVTWKTPERKRWGRFYLPGITTSVLTVEGRLQAIVRDTICNAARGLADKTDTGGALTVFSRKHWNHQDPSHVQVDDVVDIVRRRRFSKPNGRSIQSIP